MVSKNLLYYFVTRTFWPPPSYSICPNLNMKKIWDWGLTPSHLLGQCPKFYCFFFLKASLRALVSTVRWPMFSISFKSSPRILKFILLEQSKLDICATNLTLVLCHESLSPWSRHLIISAIKKLAAENWARILLLFFWSDHKKWSLSRLLTLYTPYIPTLMLSLSRYSRVFSHSKMCDNVSTTL